MSDLRAGTAYALASTVCLAAVPILISAGLEAGAAALALLTVRTGTSAVAAWALVVPTSRGELARRLPLRQEPLLFAGATLGIVIGPLAGFFGLARLEPTVFTSIYYLQVPLIALVITRLRLEPASRAALASACLCAAGVTLVAGFDPADADGIDLLGLLLSAVAVAGAVLLAVALHHAGPRVHPVWLNAEFMTYAALLCVVVSVSTAEWREIDAVILLFGPLIALGAWLPGRLFWTYAVRAAGARTASLFSALTPVLVAVASVAFLDQPLSTAGWAGIVLVCLGVGTTQVRRREPAVL